MTHVRHYVPAPGYTAILTPGDGQLKHITLGVLRLNANETITFRPETDHEAALTIATGVVDVAARDGQRWEALGGRASVFEGPTDTVFAPAGHNVDLHAVSNSEIIIAQARSDFKGPVALFSAADAMVEHRGKPGWQRDVMTYIKSTSNANRLILGEVTSGISQWSSFPPHKHDVDKLPEEANLEEIYLFRIEPETGFAFQGLYSLDNPDTRNQAYVIRNNDAVAIPGGYHPVAVAPGHRIYYYWVVAGIGHTLKVHVEDNQRWLEPEWVMTS